MNSDLEQPRVVDREPGEIVLRAEPVREDPPPPPAESLNYCRPLPRLSRWQRWRDEITIPRLILAAFVLCMLVVVLSGPGLRPHKGSEQARIVQAQTDIKSFELALEAFKLDTGRYPPQAEGLAALLQSPDPDSRDPYIRRLPLDPWAKPYEYVYPGVHNVGSFDIRSLGPDRRVGNDDLTNWTTP